MCYPDEARVLPRAGVQGAQSKCASAVINMNTVEMLQWVGNNAAENSMVDSAGVNQSYRACMLTREDFHAADVDLWIKTSCNIECFLLWSAPLTSTNYHHLSYPTISIYNSECVCLLVVNAKTMAQIDAKCSGIMKNYLESVLCELKSPVLVLSGRYREISGFFFVANRQFYSSPFHFRLLPRILLTQSAFAGMSSTTHCSREYIYIMLVYL